MHQIIGIMGLVCCVLVAYGQEMDSLRKALDTASTAQIRANLMDQLSGQLIQTQPDTAAHYAQQMLHLAQEHGLLQSQRKAYNLLGALAYYGGRHREAEAAWHNMLRLAQREDNPDRIAATYNNLALVYSSTSREDSALVFYAKALRLWHGNAARKATVLNNMGMLYERQNELSKALDHFKESLHIFDSLNAPQRSIAYLNVGKLTDMLFNDSLALPYYYEAIRLKKQQQDHYGLALSYVNLASARANLPDTAMRYYALALELAEKSQSDVLVFEVLHGMAAFSFEQAQYQQTQQLCAKALPLALKIGDQKQQMAILDLLHQSYAELGQPHKAYHYLLDYKTASDSVFDADKRLEINKIEAGMKMEQFRLQQDLKEARLAKELAVQRRYRLIAMIGAAFLLVIALMAYRGYRLVRFKNRQLLSRDQAITRLNQTLEQQVQDRVAQLEEYAFMNSHNVRGPLARIQGLANLFAVPNAIADDEKEQIAKMIFTAADELDEVIQEINQRLNAEHEPKAKQAPRPSD